MNKLKSIWDLLKMSSDAVMILEDDKLVKYNRTAADLLNKIELKVHEQFNLSRFSPKFQPCGKLSLEMEKESREIAFKKGYVRFEWVLVNSNKENCFVEGTLIIRENKGKSLSLISLRMIGRQEQEMQILERQREEIIRKNEEIKIQRAEIELQKEQIEIQRDLAEKQRDEITVQKKALIDSIKYASRIQSALLPDYELLDSSFSEFFILNKPKDILSGDFYWFSEKNDRIVIAVADCTGHGVPGALLSVLGMKFLDEIVNGDEITQPDKILDRLREQIIRSIGQAGKNGVTNDGMDIALLSIDRPKFTLHFAGALNPIFILRNNELREIKGDRLPLGMQTISDKYYSNHKVILEPHDSIYLFSDGYADQFGWRTNKKFTITNFRELIKSIQNLPMKAQKILLENNLKNWMGDLEQIDDILVVGLKIKQKDP